MVQAVEYNKNRAPDYQYTEAVRRVLTSGMEVPTSNQGEPLLVCPGIQFVHDLRDGLPLLTLRSLSVAGPDGWAIWRHAVGEICAFLNGARTVADLHRYGSWFWDKWGTPKMCAMNSLPNGDLGDFYGKVWTDFNGVNQIERMMERLRRWPYAKHHVVSNWNPLEVESEDLGFTMPCRPCHGDFQLVVYDREGQTYMDLLMKQRSGDLPIGVPHNTFQYAVLLLALAQIFGFQAGRLIHTINHCHIYTNQIPAMEELINREPRPFPEVGLHDRFISEATDIRHLRRQYVYLVDGTYNPHPPLENELPVLL